MVHTVAVVGYGNQGRSWALNLRDSGVDPRVCVRDDESREQAIDRMIAEAETMGANAVVCVRFTTSYVMGSAAEILVFGDAVVVEKE